MQCRGTGLCSQIPANCGSSALRVRVHATTDIRPGQPDQKPPLPAPRRPRRRILEFVLIVAAIAAVLWFHYWTNEINHGFGDHEDHDYYRLLVRGWRKGHLHLDKEPSPALLALADPYDPAQNGPHRLGDASYYKGKYYLYFGAAPAATLMFPYHLVTGREMPTGAAVFVFGSIGFLAAAGVWLALRRRYFPDSAVGMAPLGLLALGFGTHLLALAQRPKFWELPIAAGIAFLMLALASVYLALHGRRPLLAMAAAGLFVGLATASRPTCLFAAPLLLAPLWAVARRRGVGADAGGSPAQMAKSGSPAWWQPGLAAAVPLGLCGVAVMLYNYARFENPFEFGQSYQLSGAYEGQLQHFSLRFLPHNVAVYFFQPLAWTWDFPFVFARGIPVDIPGYFGTEEVSGLAVTFPFFWFLLALPLAWWRRSPADAGGVTACVLAIAGYALPVAGLLLCYFSTTMRYQADFAAALALLALIGMLGLERWIQGRKPATASDAPRRAWTGFGGRIGMPGLAGVLCLATVVTGVLVSFDYHGRALRRDDPKLWLQFDQATHNALAEIGRWLGQWDGPRVLKVRFRSQPPGTEETFWQATDARANERILIRHTADHLIQFGYQRGGNPPEWGRLLTWKSGHLHTVSVQVPSLHGPPREGWMRGLRRSLEFRERTSAAVWFSGGLALGVVTDPWPAGIQPGGEVGRDFSGEVRRMFTRVFREDEIGPPAWLVDDPNPGGTLRLRLRFPDQLAAEGEPLYAAGALYGSDIVFVRPAGGGVKFVFEKYGQPQVESEPIALASGDQIVELDLPSFNAASFGSDAIGDVVIRLNGAEVLRTRQYTYAFPAGSEAIGRNPFYTTCAAEFRGWVLDAKWVK